MHKHIRTNIQIVLGLHLSALTQSVGRRTILNKHFQTTLEKLSIASGKEACYDLSLRPEIVLRKGGGAVQFVMKSINCSAFFLAFKKHLELLGSKLYHRHY